MSRLPNRSEFPSDGPFRRRLNLRLLILMAFGVGLGLAMTASAAAAHGPTVEITHHELKPALLNLYVGTTVHFSNTVAMPGGHVVVDEGGTIESPALEKPGDGWHHTFERAGTYEIFIRQHPKSRMRIVVVPRKKPGQP